MSTDTQIYSVIIFTIYLSLIGIISYRNRKDRSLEGYAIGNRKISFWGTLAALVASFRDGAGLAVWVALAYYFGYGALWLTVGMSLALVLLAGATNKIKQLSNEKKYITTGDLFKDKFGPNTEKLASYAVAITALLYAASQLFVAGKILSSLFNINGNLGILFTAAIVATYLIIGGYKTVIQTDLLRWGIIMLIVFIPVLLANGVPGNLNWSSFAELDIQNKIGFAGISFLVVFCTGDVWQRIFSAKSTNTARNAFLATIPTYFMVSIGLVMLGAAIKLIMPESTPENAFFDLFRNPNIPPLLIATVGIFAAASMMSSLDTETFLFATTISRNLTNSAKTAVFIKRTALSIVVLLGVLTLIAFTIKDIMEFLFGAVTLETVLVPLLIYSVFIKQISLKKDADTVVAVSLLVTALVYAFLFITGKFNNLLFTLIPAGVETIFLIFIVLIFREKHSKSHLSY